MYDASISTRMFTRAISISIKPGSHLCDKHKHKHNHKLATFSHVKQAQENKAYASRRSNVGGDLEIFKMADEELACACAYLTP